MYGKAQQLKEAYRECEKEVFGVHPQNIEVNIIQNRIIILVKRTSIDPSKLPSTVRGRNIDQVLHEIKCDHLKALLKPKIADIAGCQVTSMKTDISVDDEVKIELVYLDRDIEHEHE